MGDSGIIWETIRENMGYYKREYGRLRDIYP